MTDRQRPDTHGLSAAIQAQRPQSASNDQADLTVLDRTLVKSGRWKKLALERIESVRNGTADVAGQEIIEQLKSDMGELVDQVWQDLVRTAVAKNDSSADPANDEDVKREATNARKLLALHEATMKNARHRLYEEWARVYVSGKRIETLAIRIGALEAENDTLKSAHGAELAREQEKYLELHGAFEEFRQEADQLLDELDSENIRLKDRFEACVGRRTR